MDPLLDLSPERIAQYRASALRRRESEAEEIKKLKEQAWNAAKRAAMLLREQYHVSRVVVFGSLIHKDSFTRWSDVDIAAWGIKQEDTFRAIGEVLELTTKFKMNLVDINACQPELLSIIERDGIDL